MQCSKFPERPAAGVCAYSGKPYCAEELVEIQGRMYAKDNLSQVFSEQNNKVNNSIPSVMDSMRQNQSSSHDQPASFNATQPVNLTEMYRAYIGPAKANYYVPIFERFDKGASAMSWNLPAGLITSWWMIYRGMYLWGFLLYPILYLLAALLFAIPIMMVAGDKGADLANLISLPVSLTVMGLFSNKIFHRHVRKAINKSGQLGLSEQQRRDWLIRKGSSRPFFILFIILIMTAVLGILAAIAIPAYQDYTTRAKVAEGLTKVEPVKAAYLNWMLENEGWPAGMYDIGLTEDEASYGTNIASVTIDPGNALLITFSGQDITGNTLLLIPSIEGDSLVWTCRVGTLPPKYAPAICRH